MLDYADSTFWPKVDRPAVGCWEWQHKRRKLIPYGVARYKQMDWHAHVLAWMIAYGEPPAGQTPYQRCRPEHLALADHDVAAEQLRAARDERVSSVRGSKAKLTAEDVREIRRKHSEGERPASIAREFDITRTSIGRLLEGRTYRDIT
jgi:hypothetical protein